MTDQPIETTSAALEVVETPPVPVTGDAAANAAIVAASNAALVEGMPGREEFLNLAVQARLLSMSGAAQPAVRNNPHVALHMALVARDLGISLSSANEQIDIIPGPNGPRFSLSPQLLNGQVERLGLGQILKKITEADRCVAVAVGPGGIDRRCRLTWRNDVHAPDCDCDIIGESEFTWEDALMAGLAGEKCTPGNHVKDKQTQGGKKYCGCNQGYITYPKRMMWWRAAGFCADDYFPQASLGMYSPEALGAMVDENGRAIDPATVALPEGYERGLGSGSAPSDEADPDERWNLKLRIMVLPEDIQAELTETWKKSDKVGAIDKLTVSSIKVAQAMVSGAESKARTKHKWQAKTALEALAAQIVGALMPVWAQTPPSQPDPPESGDAAPTATDNTPEPENGPETAPSDRRRGEAAVEPADEDLEGAPPKLINDTIAEVLAMKAHDVDKALTGYGLHTEGELDTRKRRLTLAIVRDRKNTPEA